MTTTPKRGRRLTLTADLQRRIVALVTSCACPEVAAGACGVPRATFREWLARGRGTHGSRPPTPELEAFAAEVDRAIDTAEARLVLKQHEYIEGLRPHRRDPSRRVKSRLTQQQIFAAQWVLARRFPERWGQHTAPPVTISATQGDAVEHAQPTITIVYHRDADSASTDPAVVSPPAGFRD